MKTDPILVGLTYRITFLRVGSFARIQKHLNIYLKNVIL